MSLTKSKINLLIDLIMFLFMTTIASIGFLIRFVLLPGFKRNETYGKDVSLSFWGLDRHQWGTIHLIFSLALILLLIIHLVLHRQRIIAISKRIIPNKKNRLVIWLGLLVFSFFLITGSFFITPEIKSDSPGQLYENSINNSYVDKNLKSIPEIKIRGSMTLLELSNTYHVPVLLLTSEMGILPQDSTRKIGQLRKKYGFSMDKLKRVIEGSIID